MNAARAGSVLLVEDERHIRKFLSVSLRAHGFEVHEAALGQDGLDGCASLRPDLVVLDLGLPDMDGQVFIRRLRDWSQIPVLVLSVRADEAEKVMALDAGANDYVTKPFGIAELMARIRSLLRTSRQLTEDEEPVRDIAELQVDLANRRVSLGGERLSLTRKEFDLLKLLVTHADRVLTHQFILKELWGPSRGDEVHHLRVLVGHLRRKLGDEPARPRYIHTEQGVGYRLKT